MKTLLISIISLFPIYLFSQETIDSLLIKKWYYCDSVTIPEKLNTLLFFSEADETHCPPNKYMFYWEFKENGKYEWSDTSHNSLNNIIDGLLVIPINRWSFKDDILFIGENEFIIDVLNNNRLLIHRREE